MKEPGEPILLSATGDVVATRNGTMSGFYVSSTSSGVIVLKRGGSGGTAVSGSITPGVGWHDFPASFTGGLHMTLSSGSIAVTFFVN